MGCNYGKQSKIFMSTGYRSLDLQHYKQGCELNSYREYQET